MQNFIKIDYYLFRDYFDFLLIIFISLIFNFVSVFSFDSSPKLVRIAYFMEFYLIFILTHEKAVTIS